MTVQVYPQEAEIRDLRAERDALLDDLTRAERQLTAARDVRRDFAAKLRQIADDLDGASLRPGAL